MKFPPQKQRIRRGGGRTQRKHAGETGYFGCVVDCFSRVLELDPASPFRSDGFRRSRQKGLFRPEVAGRKSRPLVFGLPSTVALVICFTRSKLLEAFLAVGLQDPAVNDECLGIGCNLNCETSAVLTLNAPIGNRFPLVGRRAELSTYLQGCLGWKGNL